VDFRRVWLRAKRGARIGVLGALAAAALILVVYAAVVPTGQTLPLGSKATPFSLTVFSSSSLPPEVQAQEAATAPLLFDRDTTTQHVAFAVSSVQTTFESPQAVTAVKVFGAAPYLLSVQADAGGSFQAIAGLQNLNLTLLPAAWNTFRAAAPVTTGKLLFTLTPATGGSASGLRELEVWTTATPVTVKNSAALLAQLLGPTPPPQGRFYTALNASTDPTTAVVTPNDSSKTLATNTFSFTLDRDPAHFVRAYLTYELYGQASFVSVERIINGSKLVSSLEGGSLILPTTTWSTQIERINPAWFIRGSNTVEFKVLSSSYTNGGFTVRNVRMVLELDTGANTIETISANEPDALGSNPIEALYDGDLTTGWKPYPPDQPIDAVAPSVDFSFRRPTQMDAVSLYLSAPITGQVQLSVKQAGVWSDFPAEAGASFDTGWNTIYVPATVAPEQRAYQGARLTFSGGFGSSTEVREFLFIGSAVGGRTVPPKIFITYPDAGQFYGRRGWVQGFVEPWDNGSGTATITFGGLTVGQTAGEISYTVTKDQAGFTTQADSDAWSADVKVVYPNGETLSTTVAYTQQLSPAAPASGALAASLSATVSPTAKKTVSNDESVLNFPAGSVSTSTTVTIQPLADTDVPALDIGMTNVTKGPRRGYRYLPHGAKFLQTVAVTTPYDRGLIPPGHTEDDVTTFYFDDQAGRWIALPRVSVDKTNKVINSTTDHFTDMINAVVTVPDHPQTVSFNPTSMKDIKAADPGAQVNLIEPPRANNTGDARLTYPIEVPPGRQGLQPQLAVSYSSSGGNGWMGMGWDVPMQAIVVDTRWGVPRYDANSETETYMMSGEMLTPVAHRGALAPRNATGDKVFHARVEGQFKRIVRHGQTPSTYTWEVTDKNGVRYLYGATDPASETLVDGNNNIFLWALCQVIDPNGNFVRYHYTKIVDPGVLPPPGRIPVAGSNIYLTNVTYTGNAGIEGPYSVALLRDRDLLESRRGDVQIDARGGFKRVTADLLRRVDVSLSGQLIRRYEFKYNENPYGDNRPSTAFNKTLLSSISQFGADGVLFNKHTLTYFDEVRNASGVYQPFAAPQAWTPGSDNLKAGFVTSLAAFPDTASALSGQKGQGTNVHFMVSIGFYDGNLTCKSQTVGGKFGFSTSSNEGLLALVDVDGDGLPDKVFAGGSGLSWRQNQSGPGGGTVFGPPRPIGGAGRFSQDKSKNRDFGIEAVLGCSNVTATAGVNVSNTTTRTEVYFSDVNGDGLMDLVVNGTVFFNRLDAAGNPSFVATSAGTPNPIGTGAVDASAFPGQSAQALQALVAQHPLHDTVRTWEAPFAGTVAVSGTVRLIQDTSAERVAYADKADGVRVAIQRAGTELWSDRITGTDYTLHTPAGVGAVVVNRGDRIYFRVQSVFDGAFDQVEWAPAITYTSESPLSDANGKPEFTYSAGSDFLISAYFGQTVAAPLTGQLAVTGTFSKPVTSDDVTVRVLRNQAVVFQQQLPGGQPANVPVNLSLAVTAADQLRFLVTADTNVDWSAIGFTPSIFYTQTADPSIQAFDAQGRPQIRLKPAVEYSLYTDRLQDPAPRPWIAPAAGTFFVSPVLQLAPDANGTIAFTAKRNGLLLAKQILTVTNGVPTLPQLSVTVAQGDAVWVEFHSASVPKSKVLAASANVGVAPGDPQPTPIAAAYYAARSDARFGPMYRQWGQFVYNGEGAFGTAPIDETVLVMPTPSTPNTASYSGITDPTVLEGKLNQDGYDPTKTRFVMMVPDLERRRWLGFDDLTWVQATSLSSSRLGDDDLTAPSPVPPGPGGGTGASAVVRTIESSDKSFSFAVGASGGGFGASGGPSVTTGQTKTLAEFIDMNGDRYPDIVSPGTIQYTTMLGALEPGARGTGLEQPKSEDTQNDAVTAGGSYGKATPGPRPMRTVHEASMNEPSLGLNGSFGRSGNTENFGFADVNGDGLPDRVYSGGDVALNLGYRFAPREPWGFGQSNVGKGESSSAGLGFNLGAYSIGGGVSLARSDNQARETLLDVNGDGLPDKILVGDTLQVAINTGTGFLPFVPWTGAANVNSGSSSTESVSAYFTICIPIIPIAPVAKLCFNAGAGASQTASRQLQNLSDIDGDGYADVLTSSTDNVLTVARSTIGRTNLLKRVLRPLGATIDLEYTRDGNTFDLPQSRWTMSKLTVFDGHAGEGADTQITTFRYSGPKYNRLERDFYGYGSVAEEHRDTQNLNALYRTITRDFLNDSYYTKGLLKRELTSDATARPFTETENTYVVRDESTGLPIVDPNSATATGFPQLTRTDRRFFEGQLSPGKTTFTMHAYDAFGNIATFADDGEPGTTADNVFATIAYTNCQPAYIIKPNHIEVRGNGTLMRLRDANIDCTTGNLTQVRQSLADLTTAVTDLTYFANGNLQTVTGPANKNAQRYSLTYTYDPTVATHVASISDSFGLSSSATYNLSFGKVVTTTDTNGNQTTNFYDSVGRIDHIVGPYEQGQATPTLAFFYHPEAAVPYAITRHVDKDADGNPKSSGTIDTILFTDGLKRVVQTKKDATVLEGNATAAVDKMIVSGQVSFDAFGRTVTQRYPTTEVKASDVVNGVFNAVADTVAPTTMAYDILDRNTQTTIPDGSFTTISYGFGPDRAGLTQFETVVTDANVNALLKGAVKRTYRDVRELITSVKEFNNSGAQVIWTSYAYDALKEITQVVDNLSNTTNIAYDNFGRRTAIDNPDTGRTETQYDLASNVTAKITANLRAQSKSISYSYDFNRLSAITYPNFPGNNVSYTYGLPGAAFNTAGRITRITSQMGIEERQYGKLGETVDEKKTVTTFTDALHPLVFETKFLFETFGRLLRITYPDSEVLTNSYDSGGNLVSAVGIKAVAATGQNHRYQYLQSLLYDKFEQRSVVTQGNGVRTAYTYDANTRRLSNLNAVRQGNTIFQNLAYSYDKVGNILGLQNNVVVPPPNVFGGPTSQSFAYDDLYRLAHAEGTFQFSPTKTHTYTMDMGYDTIHNIASKNQLDTIVQPSLVPVTQKKTSYNFAYAYNPSGATSVQPHAPNHIGLRTYSYDLDGNQTGWTHDTNGTRRTITWDEENRIQAVFDNGQEKDYKYDDQGQRMIKRGPQGETVYVNQFFTQRQGANGTKHVYAGTTRIASKLVLQGTPNSNPAGNTPFEKDIFFYHPDHIGSTNYVTDLNGKLSEHIEYFPFGESWVEENTNQQRTPYLFSAKELDEETGLYYFGARYYDPRTSVWQTADPVLGKYLPSVGQTSGLPATGGVFNSANLNLYAYVGNAHPLNARDPDGNWALVDDAIAIVGGAAVGVAAQGVTDLFKGEMSSWKSYVAAGVGGAAGAEAALYTGGIAAGAAGGAAYSLTNQILNKGVSNISVGELAMDTGVSALTAGIGSKVLPAAAKLLPNSVKGKIGETVSIGYNLLKGSKLVGTQVRIPGLSTIADSEWLTPGGVTQFVESKFGKGTLTAAQRRAQAALGEAYNVERWGYDWVGRMGSTLGNALGIGGSASQKTDHVE